MLAALLRRDGGVDLEAGDPRRGVGSRVRRRPEHRRGVRALPPPQDRRALRARHDRDRAPRRLPDGAPMLRNAFARLRIRAGAHHDRRHGADRRGPHGVGRRCSCRPSSTASRARSAPTPSRPPTGWPSPLQAGQPFDQARAAAGVAGRSLVYIVDRRPATCWRPPSGRCRRPAGAGRPLLARRAAASTLGSASRSPSSSSSTPGDPVKVVAASPLADVQRSVSELSQLLWVGHPGAGRPRRRAGVGAGRPGAEAGRVACGAEVDEISHSTLHRRVAEPTSGDEVARLAHTMNAMLDRLEGVGRPPAPVRERRVPRAAQPAGHDPHQGGGGADAAPDAADWSDGERHGAGRGRPARRPGRRPPAAGPARRDRRRSWRPGPTSTSTSW